MKPSRPYLIKALQEWLLDNDCTPHMAVDVAVKGVMVPEQFISDGQIVLNISPSAIQNFVLDDEAISFSARFGGVPMQVYVPVVAVMAIFFIFGVWLLQQDSLLGRIELWLKQRLKQRLAHVISAFIETLRHSGVLLSPRLLAYSLWLGIIAWGAEGVAFYYLLHVMGADVGLVASLFIYAFSMLIGAISFLPGGLGGAEVTMTALLMLNGMDNGAAVAATLLIRLTTLWFAVVLGLFAILPGRRTFPTGTNN